MPIAERHQEYAQQVNQRLQDVGVRTELSMDNTLNYRIRRAQTQKVPYMLVLGDRELEDEQVAIRLRNGENMPAQSLEDTVAMIAEKIASRADG